MMPRMVRMLGVKTPAKVPRVPWGGLDRATDRDWFSIGSIRQDGVDHFELREPDASYDVHFVEEKPHLRVENQYYSNQI